MQRLVQRRHFLGRCQLRRVDAAGEERKFLGIAVNMGVAVAGAGGNVEIHRRRRLRGLGKGVSVWHGHSGRDRGKQNTASRQHRFSPSFLSLMPMVPLTGKTARSVRQRPRSVETQTGQGSSRARLHASPNSGPPDRRPRNATPNRRNLRCRDGASRREPPHRCRSAGPRGAQTLQANFSGASRGISPDRSPERSSSPQPSSDPLSTQSARGRKTSCISRRRSIRSRFLLIRRRRRLPEIIVGVVMRDGEGVGQGAAEARDARA